MTVIRLFADDFPNPDDRPVPIFVDWLTVHQMHAKGGLPVINRGSVFSVDEDGAVEWQLERKLELEGSFESRLLLQCDGQTISASGNVGRFDRPDNVFGFDLDACMDKWNRVLARFGLPPFTKGEPFLRHGYLWHTWTGAWFTRIDLTGNFMTGGPENVHPFMRHLAAQSVSRMKTGSFPDGYTVDYGRGSKFWYAKAYAKFPQLVSPKQKKSVPQPEVLEFVRDTGMVRFEFTAKSRFLTQNGLRYWGGTTMKQLELIFREKSEVIRRETSGYQSFEEMFSGLPAATVKLALRWKAGEDMSDVKRSQYYAHRKRIKDHCGIDIALPCNVVDLSTRVKVKEITVTPLVAPDWYWRKTGNGI